ncbi:MAG TPA: SPFH domain-containing protein [Candidatus Acidoferrales bacterium]|nr:SPFH domain-containing protein [Candidatus Acidoferrales bacterium]
MIGTSLIVIVVAAIVAFVIGSILFRSMWRVAEPNEALIISGVRHGKEDALGFKIVTGSGTLVAPGLQTVRRLSLKLHEAQLSTDCVTQQGIQVGIRGVAIYKIGDDPASIANAARRFLDQKDDVMDRNIQNLFDGHLRSIIGGMTMEDLIRDRTKLTDETREAAGADMSKLGLILDSLQIKDIVDPTNYVESLAAPHVAEVQKTARIAQALANQEATQAEQASAALNAQSVRDTAIKQASFKADVDKAQASASQAGPLAEAIAKQEVVKAATTTAELEADRRQQELQLEVARPADAEAYAIKVKAEAERDAAIAAAQGQAQRTELQGKAEAAAIQVRGEAEGAAIKAKLLAEAEGIKARSDALAANPEAVMGQSMAENMPAIVREAAQAYGNIKQLVVLDGATGMNNTLRGIVGFGATLLPLLRNWVDSGKASETAARAIDAGVAAVKKPAASDTVAAENGESPEKRT